MFYPPKRLPAIASKGRFGIPPVIEDDLGEPLEASGAFEDARRQPDHGMDSIPSIVAWWSDGEDSRYTE